MRKLITRLFFCMALMAFGLTSLSAQTVKVSGKVIGSDGLPVINAVLIDVTNPSNGVISDLDGNFTISVKAGDTIEVSSLGMETRRVVVKDGTRLTIILNDDRNNLDEVVVVGYGTQKRGSLTAAVSQMDGDELLKAPTANVSNMLAGRVSGLTAVQQSGQPGADGASLLIRGQSVLPIVDGVVRSFDQINPDDIESVTILKDAAAAAVYGLDGNTVIIVTTKKGSNKESTISYRGTYGVSMNSTNFGLLDGPGYAYWYNRALELDGKTPVFTKAIVEKMKAGQDGWGNTDWYSKVFGVGRNTDHTISVNGGTDKITYFASLGVLDQKGNVENFNFRRYNARLNATAKIARNLRFEAGISGNIQQRNQPVYSANPDDWNNVAQQAMRVHPYVPEYVTIDGQTYHTATATASATVNPVAAYQESGFNKNNSYNIQTNMGLTWDVPFVRGLSAKIFGSYDMGFTHAKVFSTPYELALGQFQYDSEKYISKISYTHSQTYSGLGSLNSLTEASYYSTYANMQINLNYSRSFGKHNVGALVLWEIRESNNSNHWAKAYDFIFKNLPELSKADKSYENRIIEGGSSMKRQAGLVARLNYNYDERYLLELSGRYDGTYLFSGMNGSRWGFFPAGSAGWVISREPWFDASFVKNLKLRAGAGLTGTSAVNAFEYLSTMTVSNANSVIIGGAGRKSMWTYGVANPWLTWEKNLNYNAGLDANLWNDMLGIEFDVFYTYKYDMLSSPAGSYPPSMGGYYPRIENKNKQDIRGFELTLSHFNHIGDFNYGIKFTGSYAYRRWLVVAGDPKNAPDYQKLTGKEVGSVYGFIDNGLFQSEEEIRSYPTMIGKPIRVGDIKYIDRNGDGKISYEQDCGYVGSSIYPRFTAGLSLEGNWRWIDFNCLIQGGIGNTIALTGIYTSTGSAGIMDNTAMTKPFYHDGNSPRYLVENAWTPENKDAYFPRLSLDFSSNNAYSSTRWYRPGDYVRLKSAQIGFTLPGNISAKAGIRKLRLYFEGSNLLTLSHVSKYNIDPEMPSVNNGYYPQQRVVSVGLNITL